MGETIVIALDGTSASGKSTNAKLVAKALGKLPRAEGLAVTLEKIGHSAEAKAHWRSYRDLAPEGEWVELAKEFSE